MSLISLASMTRVASLFAQLFICDTYNRTIKIQTQGISAVRTPDDRATKTRPYLHVRRRVGSLGATGRDFAAKPTLNKMTLLSHFYLPMILISES